MKNLEDKIGLPVLLHDDNRLEFGEGVEHDKMSVRKFSDLAPVTADKSLELSNEPAYNMYRNVLKVLDSEKISQNHIRFDLTVLPPAKLGDEFVKTFGHDHPKKEGTQIAYPELYFAIVGQIRFIIQNSEKNDVATVVVKEGEAIIIPPNYGHVMVNESENVAVMADWISGEFESDYSHFENKRGAAYYFKTDKNFVKNKNYPDMNEIRELKSASDNILEGELPYNYIDEAEKLDFLNNPENYQRELNTENIFS